MAAVFVGASETGRKKEGALYLRNSSMWTTAGAIFSTTSAIKLYLWRRLLGSSWPENRNKDRHLKILCSVLWVRRTKKPKGGWRQNPRPGLRNKDLSSTWGNPHSEACACVLSHLSRVWLLAILWTVAHQALLSVGLSGQEYWSGLPCPPPGDLANPGIEPTSPMAPALQVDSLPPSPI